MDVDSALTAAMRRRQRRLRQFLRHERLSVAMALAEKLQGQRFARAGEEGHEEHDALRRQRPPPPQPEFFQLYEEEPSGSWPPCLGEPLGPQEEVQQCTVEQFADVVPMVQILDTEVLRMLDVPAFEQVIAVPKISFDRVPQRSALRRPQKADQLVEVPTEPGYSLAVIAVQARGRRAAAAMAEQILDNPVPQGRGGGGGGRGCRRSSRFTCRTGFYSECEADRCFSCSWRSPRFSLRPGFLIESILSR